MNSEDQQPTRHDNVDIGSVGRDVRESVIVGGNAYITYSDSGTPPSSQVRQSHQAKAAHARSQPVYETLELHNFDLRALIGRCITVLRKHQGLVGFVIPYDSEELLGYFCERLRIEWGREKTLKRDPIFLKEQHTSMNYALSKIKANYIPRLQSSDVLFPVQIFDRQQLFPFWERLKCACTETFGRRMIAVMALRSTGQYPQDIIPLEQPKFEIPDVYEWIRKVAEALNWPENTIDRFVDLLEQRCADGTCLSIESVYLYLETASAILREEQVADPEEFFKTLHERCL